MQRHGQTVYAPGQARCATTAGLKVNPLPFRRFNDMIKHDPTHVLDRPLFLLPLSL
jgi:hypothetical protein